MRWAAAMLTGVFATLIVAALKRVPIGRIRQERRPRSDWLAQAGLRITPPRFVAVSVAAGTAAALVTFTVSGVVAVSIAPGVLVALAPRFYYGRRRQQRIAEVQQALPDGLRDLIASISSGMSLVRAIEALAKTGPAPLREAFGDFHVLWRTHGVATALETIKDDLAHPASDRVIEVLILAHERGGAAVPQILRDLADAASRDVWLMEEIQSQSLEQRINARAVFALPWLVLVAITARQGAFREFYSSSAGLLVVGLGAAMSGLGMAFISRLSRQPDEPRVFGP